MKLWQIDHAVNNLCSDVNQLVKRISVAEMTETQLVYELLICILGSGVRYEIAVAYAAGIRRSRLVSKKMVLKNESSSAIQQFLTMPVHAKTTDKMYKRYRYPARGANCISQSLFNIYSDYGSLKKLVSLDLGSFALRRELIRICPGIGPKQASHFLKNIGYTDEVAIIDRHIIRYMEIAGDKHLNISKLARIDKYEEVEIRFISIVRKFKYSVSVVDQAMWFVMRALNMKVVT
ncbi:MAG: hypothetical protein HRU23_12130 [Gammaproteobacteria bacterium]|nr:hypothetical protein [Gammaproteobacteria bacterium]